MFARNFDKLKTNSALKAVYRVKHHLKWLKIKCRSPELQGLSCRNNIVTACCSSAGRTAGVCPAFSSAAAQGRRVARDCPAHSTGSHVIQSKCIWRCYDIVLARPTSCWWSSGEYIYAFICIQFFKHTQLSLAITQRSKICVALVQRHPRTISECWRTTDARKTLWQKIINFQCVGRALIMCDWALRSEKNPKMLALRAHITPIQRVPNACLAHI